MLALHQLLSPDLLAGGSIVNELRGEKIDIIKYSEDPAEFIAAALAPADVVDVQLSDEGKMCRVVVPDDQLSLAIGKEGQNARLAARLTGYPAARLPGDGLHFHDAVEDLRHLQLEQPLHQPRMGPGDQPAGWTWAAW